MYKRILNLEDRLHSVAEDIRLVDLDLDSNPDAFLQLKEIETDIVAIRASVSGFTKDIRSEIDSALKGLSTCVKDCFYTIYYAHISEHIENVRTLLFYLILNPYFSLDELDEYALPALDLRNNLWRFIAHYYAASSQPDLLISLCDSTKKLSKDDFLSLMEHVVDKICVSDVSKVLEKVSCRDDKRKTELSQTIRKNYPNASNKYNHILLGKTKRNIIKKDFLQSIENSLLSMLEDNYAELSSGDFYSVIDFFSILLVTFANEKALNNMFSVYVSSFLDEQFQSSDQKNIEKQQTKDYTTKAAISSVLIGNKESVYLLQPLPVGLSDAIRGYLITKNITGNSDSLFRSIEKVLQKIFTKKIVLRKDRFINKIKSFGYDCIDDDFFAILEKHGFSCIDTSVSSALSSDNVASSTDKDVFDKNTSDENTSDKGKQQLLDSLKDIDLIAQEASESKKEFLSKKISGYVDIFQKLNYSFDNKEKFIKNTVDICISNDRLLKEIKKIIYDIVVKNREEEFKSGRDFYVFNMAKGWRIVLYKKSVIGDIGDHRFYDKALKNKI